MAEIVKVEGLRALKIALHELPKTTAKNAMKRVLMKRAQPIASRARSLAPVDEGDLRQSIIVGSKLSKRQRSRHQKAGPDDVEVFVGPGPLPQAHLQEFGTSEHPPQPFLRPAWDAERRGVLEGIGKDLWAEIEKAAKRLARKAAKAAAAK